jgi:hypothetical protein
MNKNRTDVQIKQAITNTNQAVKEVSVKSDIKRMLSSTLGSVRN